MVNCSMAIEKWKMAGKGERQNGDGERQNGDGERQNGDGEWRMEETSTANGKLHKGN